MKKSIWFLSIFSFVVILFSACSKNETTAKTTTEKVQAKWNIQHEYDHQFYAGYNTYDTITGTVDDYFDFRTDGMVYYKAGSSLDTSSYVISGDDKIITYGTGSGTPTADTLFIQSLTDNSLQLYSKSYKPFPDYEEYTIYLTK